MSTRTSVEQEERPGQPEVHDEEPTAGLLESQPGCTPTGVSLNQEDRKTQNEGAENCPILNAELNHSELNQPHFDEVFFKPTHHTLKPR